MSERTRHFILFFRTRRISLHEVRVSNASAANAQSGGASTMNAARFLGAAGKTGAKATKLWGTVVSSSMEKTVVVEVERWSKHPRVGKIIKHRRKFPAHDESEAARVGDRVVIEQCRPISKTKFYTMTEIVTEADYIDRSNPSVVTVAKTTEPAAAASAATAL